MKAITTIPIVMTNSAIQLGRVRRQHLALDKDAPVYGVLYLRIGGIASCDRDEVCDRWRHGLDQLGLTRGVTARFI